MFDGKFIYVQGTKDTIHTSTCTCISFITSLVLEDLKFHQYIYTTQCRNTFFRGYCQDSNFNYLFISTWIIIDFAGCHRCSLDKQINKVSLFTPCHLKTIFNTRLSNCISLRLVLVIFYPKHDVGGQQFVGFEWGNKEMKEDLLIHY